MLDLGRLPLSDGVGCCLTSRHEHETWVAPDGHGGSCGGAVMTSLGAGPVAAMNEPESWARLAGSTLGRLAISVDGQPDVFPVNFVVQHRSIFIRTAEGTKLAGAAVNRRVAFEVDEHDTVQGWSVVVKGHARIMTSSDELAAAERARCCRGSPLRRSSSSESRPPTSPVAPSASAATRTAVRARSCPAGRTSARECHHRDRRRSDNRRPEVRLGAACWSARSVLGWPHRCRSRRR